MRKDKRFSRKDTVRFQLVPGVNNKGEPTVLYKPVENKASKVSEEKTKKIISQISDYD